MKKYCYLIMVLLFVTISGYGQTDEYNKKKYWKFRNDFRQNFIKIGPEAGESLPMARRGPTDCVDLTDDEISKDYGTLYWGDGTIRHGHYLGFLATEYTLLKKNNEDLTAIKNELYYAINALNRLDRTAERLITELKDECIVQPESLNGFYLRDDVPQNFESHWEDEKISAGAVHGFYDSNNSDDHDYATMGPHTLHPEGTHYYAHHPIEKHTQHWMTASLDQMTSLLVGLKVCHQLLEDDLTVQPKVSDPNINLKDEVENIVDRLVRFGSDHNWFLLDMKGWPVGNGGGELFLQAHALIKTAESITGLTYSDEARRRVKAYKNARAYDEAPTLAEKELIWDDLSLWQRGQVASILEQDIFFIDEILPGVSHLLNPSEFELWQDGFGALSLDVDLTTGFWSTISPLIWNVYEADWEDDYKFNSTFGGLIGLIKFKELNLFAEYNKTIMFNLGVSSGIFSSSQVSQWGTETENYQLVLIDALLNDSSPAMGSKSFFQSLLNSMPISGSYKFEGPHGDDYKQKTWSKDWPIEYRWTKGNGTIESDDAVGQYSGLDYMYLHNLYSLIYEDELPSYEEHYSCICEDNPLDGLPVSDASPTIFGPTDTESIVAMGATIKQRLRDRFDILDFCIPNAFEDILSGELSDVFELKQLFGDAYHDIEILLNEYQTEFLTIEPGGVLNIESRLVVCENKVLKIKYGGDVNLVKGEIRLNENAQLIIEGELNVLEGTKVILEKGARLIIKNGGELYNEGYIQMNENAIFRYEDGAELTMPTWASELHFDGGNLEIGAGATFKMNHAGYTNSGHLRFSASGKHIYGETGSRFQLIGKNEYDRIMIIEEGADFWTNNVVDLIKIDKGRIYFDKNSRLVATTDYYSNSVSYHGNEENRGLALFHINKIVGGDFKDVPINAPLYFSSLGILQLFNCKIDNYVSEVAVKVIGGKYNIQNTEINTDKLTMISSSNMTRSARLLNSTLNASGPHTLGVSDRSNVELYLGNNIFNNHYVGTDKEDGILRLGCNEFNNFDFFGVSARKDCILRMASISFSGYNSFIKKDDNAIQVNLDGARGIGIYNGYNKFQEGGVPTIYGRLRPIVMFDAISGKANKWKDDLGAPDPSFDYVINDFTEELIPIFPTERAEANCGAHNPSGGVIVYVGETNNNVDVPVQFTFGIVGISEAVGMATEQMEEFNSNGNNTIAMNMFHEILMYNYQNLNQTLEGYLDNAQSYMKQTLDQMFDSGVISNNASMNSFHPIVQQYVDVLNNRSNEVVVGNNYYRQFYIEMDKMHLFHLLGNRTIGLNILSNVESCGVLAEEQAYINNWKEVLESEQAKINYGYEAAFIDSVWTDTSVYLQPTSQQNIGNFGSMILSPNMLQSSSCNNQSMQIDNNPFEIDSQIEGIVVYPNPTTGKGKLVLEHYNKEENYSVIIRDLLGKIIRKDKIEKEFYEFDLTNENSGIYIIELKNDQNSKVIKVLKTN